MMVTAVFGPCSRGIRNSMQIILCIFPHWYVGILVPFLIGGLIPGFLTLIPWVYAICCTQGTDIWGCSAAATINREPEVVGMDQAGNEIRPGDVVMMKVTVKKVETWPHVRLIGKN
jgi:hypothetical protein